MKTQEFIVTGEGRGIQNALLETEKVGADSRLTRKEVLQLRLLAEELFGLMRGVTGNVEGHYFVEHAVKDFSLHLRAKVSLSQEMRKELLKVSSSGKNAAAKGVMGKIRDMIGVLLLPRDDQDVAYAEQVMWASINEEDGAYDWSLIKYREETRLIQNDSAKAAEAWDELEKSIVANIADEVRISIKGSDVEIVIDKSFK